MKITQHSNTALLFSVFFTVAASFGFAVAEDFQEISGVPQDLTSLLIEPDCGVDRPEVPNLMFTIEVANSVTVSTSPPNLFTVSDDGGALAFKWNHGVASTASSGGVKIGIPADQLEVVSIGFTKVQIAGAFNKVNKMEVYGASTVHADLSSNTVPMVLEVSGGSVVTLKSGSNLSGSFSGNSDVTVETPSLENISVSGDTFARVNGNVNDVSGNGDSVSVSGGSKLTVTGDLSGGMSNSGNSETTIAGDASGDVSNSGNSIIMIGGDVSDKIVNSGKSTVTIVGDLSGAVDNSGRSTLNAASCGGNVGNFGGSTCVTGTQSIDAVIVDVIIEIKPETISGTETCKASPGNIFEKIFGSGSSSVYSCRTGITATAAAVAYMVM